MKHNIYTFQFVQGLIVLAFGLFGIERYINTDPIASFLVLIVGIAMSFVIIDRLADIPSNNIVSKWLFKEW